jgi:hypothetical protein
MKHIACTQHHRPPCWSNNIIIRLDLLNNPSYVRIIRELRTVIQIQNIPRRLQKSR